MTKSNTRLSRIKLLLLMFIFIAPMMASFIWFYGLGKDYFPTSHTNNAPLINPYVTLDMYARHNIEEKWTIVHRIDRQCGEICEQVLYNTRQVRAAQGKQVHRVARVIFYSPQVNIEKIQPLHADAIWLPLESAGDDLSGVFGKADFSDLDAVLVDPLGNAMMRIPEDLSPSLFLKDLKKLLRNSHIG